MKYSETVRDLAAKNAHWRYYDENFRFLRQKTLFPWDQIHCELWLQAHHKNRTALAVSPESSHKNSRQPFPTGFCWKFHPGDKCSGCNFKHECFKCGNRHPASQCTFPSRQQSNSPKNVPRSAGTFTSNKSPAASRPVSSTINTIKVDKLQFYLEGYPARSKQYLLDGFSFGFSIDYVGPRQNFSSKNLISAITNPTAVDAKLDKEIDLGRIVGPFDTRPFSVFHISPLGLIPKKLPGEFRLIHHLSFPEGHSINSRIPKNCVWCALCLYR